MAPQTPTLERPASCSPNPGAHDATPIGTGALDEHPLSFPQEQLWLVQDLRPDSTEYNEIWPLRIRGALDIQRLERAVNAVVARHDALRSTFPMRDERPVCRILPVVRLALGAPLDLGHLPEQGRDPLVERFARNLAEQPFDLVEGPLIRGSLIRISADEHVLLIGTHHLVADGWSLRVFLAEVGAYYADPEALLPPAPQYTDFVRSQRSKLAGPEAAEQLEYWRGHLEGAPDVLDLHPGGLRPRAKGTVGARLAIDLDPALSRLVRQRAAEAGATTAGVLLAAFGVTLSRYADRDDLIVGTGGEGRPDERYEAAMGFFANTLPLRLRIDGGVSFAELARDVTDVSLDALDHQDLPFARLVELVGAARDLSFGPLVQVVFKTADFSDEYQEVGPLRVRYEQIGRTRSRFDLIVEVQLEPDRSRIWVEYDTVLFDAPWIRRFLRHYENVLSTVVRDAALPVRDIPMLTQEERGGWLPEPQWRGAPVAARDVVLTAGGHIAPTGVIGPLHRVDPSAVRLVGDRIEALEGMPAVAPTSYQGRMDEQQRPQQLGPSDRFPVVGGLLVPLDEVRAVIASHPSVRAAAVRLDQSSDGLGPLMAEVTPTDGRHGFAQSLGQFATEHLPKYAVPRILGAPVGPQAETGAATRARVDPPDPVTDKVRRAWQEVLGTQDVGPGDEFFAAGGHSMTATRLAAAIRNMLGVVFPVRAVFENPRFEDLVAAAAAAPAREQSGSAEQSAPVRAERLLSAPLTASQEQIWVMDQLAPGQPVYHSPILVDIDGPLDIDAFKRAFDLVASRHEALRVVYAFESARPVQRLLADPPTLSVVRFTGLPREHAAAEALRMAREDALRSFALGRDPGLRAALLVQCESFSQLSLTVHHLAMDGVGFAVLLDELATAYGALAKGRVPALPQPQGWLAYALAEQRALAEREPELTRFWSEQLAGVRELELPGDQVRGTELSFAGDHRSLLLDAAATRRFKETMREQGVTGFVLATAALTAALHRLTGVTDIPVGAAMENRTLPGSDRLVGCTTNLAVLRLDCGADPSLSQLLGRVRNAVVGAQAHQELPFPKIVKAAGCRRTRGRLPLVGVTVEWHDLVGLSLALDRCRTSWQYLATGAARNDLVFTAGLRAEGLELGVEFNTAVWTPPQIEALLSQVAHVLGVDPGTPLSRLP